jgi:hypothetical protein
LLDTVAGSAGQEEVFPDQFQVGPAVLTSLRLHVLDGRPLARHLARESRATRMVSLLYQIGDPALVGHPRDSERLEQGVERDPSSSLTRPGRPRQSSPARPSPCPRRRPARRADAPDSAFGRSSSSEETVRGPGCGPAYGVGGPRARSLCGHRSRMTLASPSGAGPRGLRPAPGRRAPIGCCSGLGRRGTTATTARTGWPSASVGINWAPDPTISRRAVVGPEGFHPQPPRGREASPRGGGDAARRKRLADRAPTWDNARRVARTPRRPTTQR